MEFSSTPTPIIISYQSKIDHTSHFLNVDDLLKSDNAGKIKNIYKDIYQSVTAYDPDHMSSLIKVEKKLYTHIIQLETAEKEKLEKENKGWKAIGLSFLTLGIRPLVLFIKKRKMESQILKMNNPHSNFSRALDQMKHRVLKKELHPKPEALKELEMRQLENIGDELMRLKSIPRIAKSLEIINKRKKLSKAHQVALGHSLELREQLKDTHYVINHGQNLELMVINIIARKLKQELEPDQYESFEPLRHDTALRHIKEDTQTVAWYRSQINLGSNNHILRRELIRGDCVLESTTSSESAIDLFTGTTNIAKIGNPLLINHLLLTIIQDYIPNEEVAQRLCNDLINLLSVYPSSGGNLYSICVPKENLMKVAMALLTN